MSPAELAVRAPQPDQEAVRARLEAGFAAYPERKANWDKYLAATRGEQVDYQPIRMDYEVVSRCNFRCVMCMVRDWPGGKRAEDLPLADFKRSLNELYGLVEIKLQGLGEPLLHPDICEMVAEAARRHIWTRLTVNGSLLHVNQNYARLIDADPGEVQVSIDGASKQVFEQIRQGAWFEKVVANARLLNRYCSARDLNKTRSWTVVQAANLHELEDIVRLGAAMEFTRMTFSVAIATFGSAEWARKNQGLDVAHQVSPERVAGLVELGRSLGIEVTFWNASQKFALHGDPRALCAWLWERAFVSSDLRIVPCCVLSNPEMMDLGDARSFMGAWNQPAYRRLRASHLAGRLPAWCRQCYGLAGEAA